MTDNLLDGNPGPQEPSNYLEALVGEGKKFSNNEELAKGKWQADNYIKHMEHQLDELKTDYQRMREDSQARANLEDLIGQLQSQQQPSSNTPQANGTSQQAQQFDPNQIESLVSNKIQEFEANRTAKQNFDMVKNKLQEAFGDDYQVTIKHKIESIGLTADDLNDLARRKPQAALELMGVNRQTNQQNFQSPPRNIQRSDSFAPTTNKRTWSYYQKLKETNPALYWDNKTQTQLFKDYAELGAAFEDAGLLED